MTSTLYTKLPHDKLKSKLYFIVDFGFKGGDKTFIILSNNGVGKWVKKTKGRLGFSKSSLKRAVNHLIENCHFNVGNVKMKHTNGIPMGIDPAPFWANRFSYFYEEEYMSLIISSDKLKARHFHSTKRFTDDFCAIMMGENL